MKSQIIALREKGLYLEFSGPNAEKYGPEKLQIWTHFTHCIVIMPQTKVGSPFLKEKKQGE